MKRLILLFVALALSWSSCHNTALSEASDPDGAAMSLPGHDGLIDPEAPSGDPEERLKVNLALLMNGLRDSLQAWSSADLRTLVYDTQVSTDFIARFLGDAYHATVLEQATQSIAALMKADGSVLVEAVLTDALISDFHMDARTDSHPFQASCYHAFKQQAGLARLDAIDCIVETPDLGIAAIRCAVVFTARVIIFYRKFVWCESG